MPPTVAEAAQHDHGDHGDHEGHGGQESDQQEPGELLWSQASRSDHPQVGLSFYHCRPVLHTWVVGRFEGEG